LVALKVRVVVIRILRLPALAVLPEPAELAALPVREGIAVVAAGGLYNTVHPLVVLQVNHIAITAVGVG